MHISMARRSVASTAGRCGSRPGGFAVGAQEKIEVVDSTVINSVFARYSVFLQHMRFGHRETAVQ